MIRAAPRFSKLSADDINRVMVIPPYEARDGSPSPQWVRGSLRVRDEASTSPVLLDFTVTGPRLRVCYSGCRWNRIVFALTGAANADVYSFERFLAKVSEHVKAQVWAQPGRYKPGAQTSTRFVMDDDYIKVASDPSMYPDELKSRLAVVRRADPSSETGYAEDITTQFYRDGGEDVAPHDIKAGMVVIPIFRLSYYRNVERFGLVLTVVKAKVVEDALASASSLDWTVDEDLMDE